MKYLVTLTIGLLLFSFAGFAQIMTTVAGTGAASSTGDGGPATAATLNNPSGIFEDAVGNIFVVEYHGAKVRVIDSSGIIHTFAGTGVSGFSGDGGPATDAQLSIPIDVFKDHLGNVYIVDNPNQRIRKVNPAGIITTVAGNGTIGYTGDGGPATNATMKDPDRLTVDNNGELYFTDADNNVVRKVDTNGIITTIAGTGIAGYSGDGGPATAAQLRPTLGVAFDGNHNLYIADGYNHVIRKINTAGIISTYAGNGSAGSTGDYGQATAATMELPGGVAIDGSCNLYITDWTGQKIRKVFTNGLIITVAGTGTAGYSGDGGPAIAAQIDGPDNLTFDPSMNLYIADFYNNRVRKVANLGETTGCPTTSVENAGKNMEGFSIQPNPTTGIIEIQRNSAKAKVADMKIVNVLGKTLLSGKIDNTDGSYRVDISQFSPGNYFIVLNDEYGNVYKSLIVLEQ